MVGERWKQYYPSTRSQMTKQCVSHRMIINYHHNQKGGRALSLIDLVKEKEQKIKGMACVDDRKQRIYISKYDGIYPTVQIQILMIHIFVDAFEQIDVATADVVGAYLLALMDNYILVKLMGYTVDIMCKVNNECNKLVTLEKGNTLLYMRLQKALYGCIQSSILCYETFKRYLENLRFILNHYYPYVANKMVEDEQCTIFWYVDDNEIQYKKP